MTSRKKTTSDNTNIRSKVLLREWVLEKMGGAANCTVLELYGGEGHMYDACYTGVKKHLAFDKKRIDRPTWIRGDNAKLILVHGDGWDVYDADAYGSAWGLVDTLHSLRSAGKYGVIVTDGLVRIRTNGIFGADLANLVGWNIKKPIGTLGRFFPSVISDLIYRWKVTYGVTVHDAVTIYSGNIKKATYYAFICEKQ